jgi:uncharacterized protein YjdB
LPGKKEMLTNDMLEVVLVDVTKSPVWVPKKQQKYYSGKKKRHTIKTLIFVDRKTCAIIAIAQDKGRLHDFKMYKETRGWLFWRGLGFG